MTEAEFQTFNLLVSPWIAETVNGHFHVASNVANQQFRRLQLYFRHEVLTSTRILAADKVPVPPFRAMGLMKFTGLEHHNAASISYPGIYFVRREYQEDESLHFHELVHILQWRQLGTEQFLRCYAEGLERRALRMSENRACPLEAMACALQRRFHEEWLSFDVAAEVQKQFERLESHSVSIGSQIGADQTK